jgi:hypothetical protein
MAMQHSDVLGEMDVLWKKFVECRGHFPYAPDTAVGAQVAETPPYYRQFGIHLAFHFDQRLTRDDIARMNAIGHWLNQNFVVRLCALLESRGVISEQTSIKHDLRGAAQLDLVRRLRNKFAHSSGKYDPTDAEQKKLLGKMGKVLEIDVSTAQDFPLAIDEVLEPLFNGCKAYVQAKTPLAGST